MAVGAAYLTMRGRSRTPWWVVEACSIQGEGEIKITVVVVEWVVKKYEQLHGGGSWSQCLFDAA